RIKPAMASVIMSRKWRVSGLAALFLIVASPAAFIPAQGQSPPQPTQVTLKGSLICNGARIPDPQDDDHFMVLFAIDGTPEIRAEVDRIIKEFYPDKGLDGEAAQKLMDQFSERLKFCIAPDSPALKDAKNIGKNHYCMGAQASAVTGV